jgi:mono/diheme cytochrome c family protein
MMAPTEMMRVLQASAAAFILTITTSMSVQGVSQASSTPEYRTLLDQYCITCHNQNLRTAGLAFDTMDLNRVKENREAWVKGGAQASSRDDAAPRRS